MTDPTPTRAEVERYSPVDIHERNADMLAEADGQWVRLSDYQALRERAEAAERDRDGAIQWRNHYRQSWLDCRDALTAARRAEAAPTEGET